ncbi:DinB family protein [Bacillus velezensis]
MDHLVGMLYSAVNENYSRLISIVSDMSQQEIDYKGPNQTYNSTAQLIRHLAYVDLNWIFRIKGEPIPKQLEEKYGPTLDQNNKIPFISGVSLKQILTDYEEVFRLNHTVDYEAEKQATIQWGIRHMADHNRYHQAHIHQLRKWFEEK